MYLAKNHPIGQLVLTFKHAYGLIYKNTHFEVIAMNDFCIDFVVLKDKLQLLCPGKLEIVAENNEICCKIYYDFSPEPLVMNGKFSEGNAVRIVLMSYRTELWINGKLADEQWPAGNCLFCQSDSINSDINVTIQEYRPCPAEKPSVVGTFTNAHGWKPEENVFVGDCMPYTCEGRYHVLYLKDRHHHSSKWGLGAHQWEHISTEDFHTWNIHPMAVDISDKSEGSICTGSHITHNGIHYLYYTIRMSDKSPAPICRSISEDGYHFRKDKNFSFALSEKYDGVNARDPKLILDGNGMYHMILTTRLIRENKGCLAHLVSDDLVNWTELEEPLYISDDDTEPECPDYIVYNGYYYLVYSLHGKAYYLYSQNPFSGWKVPANPAVPCSSVPKGAVWDDKIVFTGFERINAYAGTMTFKSATNNENGELVFEE